jgi:hypothetical protein
MVMFNQSQWTGNYVAAGVTKLTADMANFGTSDLFMRVNLEDAAFNNFASINAVDLPADGQWHQVTFDLTDAGLTNFGGAETVAQGLSNVIELRVLSAQGGPARNGDIVAGRLGMDNLHAVTATVPEPATLGAVAMLVATTALSRRRRV